MRRGKKLFACIIPTSIGFITFILSLVFYDDEVEGIYGWKLVMLISFLFILLGIIMLLALVIPQTADQFAIAFSKDAENEFWLKLYACKNEHYVRKIVNRNKRSGSRIATSDPEDYALPYLCKKNLNGEHQTFDLKTAKRNIDFEIVDARVVKEVSYFEAIVNNYQAFVYISLGRRKFEVILLNRRELNIRDEINRRTYKWYSLRDVLDSFDDLFKEVKEDGRIILDDIYENENFEIALKYINDIFVEYSEK